MKKLTVVVSVMFFAAAVSFAQNAGTAAEPQAKNLAPTQKESAQPPKKEKEQHVENIMGNIVKINTEKNEKGEITKAEIVIKTKNEEKTIQVDPKEVVNLKEGMNVKIKLVDGKVSQIKEIKKHETKKEMKKEVKKEMHQSPQSNPQTPKTN